jgi:hypothetical protein
VKLKAKWFGTDNDDYSSNVDSTPVEPTNADKV